jgi:hypothetical protein
MNESSRRIEWPASTATQQPAADMELNEKEGSPSLAQGRLAKPFASEKDANDLLIHQPRV